MYNIIFMLHIVKAFIKAHIEVYTGKILSSTRPVLFQYLMKIIADIVLDV